jgi:hypothetical protein
MHRNIAAAVEYVEAQRGAAKRYARAVLSYYRDYGTARQSGWPFWADSLLPQSTRNRIAQAIRHRMVGDVAMPHARS